ncbi:2'-5' RNA ligase family protein [Dyadobacter psychrotolerans]|uniref:2'-5' RNA ligase family protein n=1 Tax=Dyadobacter psychrotolerans TaxID=2541721 RepID=A0A4R5DV05_9BACT|nr:2'-5' RNA ligase family protein [Dyadobacter psychrotolerans]TDE14823.1 2'-5' RNA ligase family protein [Dyadobacter psychrotolerans]
MDQIHLSAEKSKDKPLIATFSITPATQSYFNQLRQKHFPAERNYIDAHLTLFHALPDKPFIIQDLEEIAGDCQPFDATAQAIVSLGYGTAFKIKSPELSLLHQKLQRKWYDLLTNQDRQKRNFHITIQNKVASQVAKKLQADLTSGFEPFDFTVYGIQLWRYLDGPWEYISTIDFKTDA